MAAKPFWERMALAELSDQEWESLCDGCGRCCLRKLEDPATGAVAYTDVSCRLLDCDSCRCRDYEHRTERVPDCVRLRPGDREQLKWMPSTCAYRLLDAGESLPEWHPLVTGRDRSVKDAGISVSGHCVSEEFIHEEEIELRIIDWVTTDS
jgi:uncharacterized cysteine cluster protein YcgN (CxxCxxCC family)